jgi:hypothetical protein
VVVPCITKLRSQAECILPLVTALPQMALAGWSKPRTLEVVANELRKVKLR